MKIPLFCQQMAKEWYFLLAKHCLEEFKLDCQLRRLTDRTIKGYYNNTLNFLIYAEKHHSITEVEEIYTLHIKHYVQYLLNKKLTAPYIDQKSKAVTVYPHIQNWIWGHILSRLQKILPKWLAGIHIPDHQGNTNSSPEFPMQYNEYSALQYHHKS